MKLILTGIILLCVWPYWRFNIAIWTGPTNITIRTLGNYNRLWVWPKLVPQGCCHCKIIVPIIYVFYPKWSSKKVLIYARQQQEEKGAMLNILFISYPLLEMHKMIEYNWLWTSPHCHSSTFFLQWSIQVPIEPNKIHWEHVGIL